jgi:anti-anti-sigma factor
MSLSIEHKEVAPATRGVTRIDSTGIGRFIDTYGRLKKTGGEMRLAGVEGAVRETFRLTRLDRVFSFYPTVEAACAGLAGSV